MAGKYDVFGYIKLSLREGRRPTKRSRTYPLPKHSENATVARPRQLGFAHKKQSGFDRA